MARTDVKRNDLDPMVDSTVGPTTDPTSDLTTDPTLPGMDDHRLGGAVAVDGRSDPSPTRTSAPMSTPTSGLHDETVAELVQRASRQTSELVRQEIRLAQAEMRQKGRQIGFGVGMVGAAGVVAFLGAGALVAAAVLGLNAAVSGWLAALIVGLVLLVVAGVMAMVGKNRAQEAGSPKPERMVGSVHDDLEHLKEQASR